MSKNDLMLKNLSDISATIQDIELHNKLVEVMEFLTPPTADEVCEALSEYYQRKVFFDKEKKGKALIVVKYKVEVVISVISNKKIMLLETLPPHLITLISKFYESEVKKDDKN